MRKLSDRSSMRTLRFASVAMLFLAEAAAAQTVEQMLPACEVAARLIPGQPIDDPAALFCMGVSEGLKHVMQSNCETLPSEQSGMASIYAAAAPSSNIAAAQAFVNFARANPASWGAPFTYVFADALEATFPCLR